MGASTATGVRGRIHFSKRLDRGKFCHDSAQRVPKPGLSTRSTPGNSSPSISYSKGQAKIAACRQIQHLSSQLVTGLAPWEARDRGAGISGISSPWGEERIPDITADYGEVLSSRSLAAGVNRAGPLLQAAGKTITQS